MVRRWGPLRLSLLRRRPLQPIPAVPPVASNAARTTEVIYASKVGDDIGTPSSDEYGALPPFIVRQDFNLPNRVPSWFVGHMYRAMRSLPILLKRKPPPLIIEVRDARLLFSSINVAFEQMLQKLEEEESVNNSPSSSGVRRSEWKKRRLIVYNKADLIDQRLIPPIINAFSALEEQEVIFINSAKNADVRKVISWAKKWAARLDQETVATVAKPDLSRPDGKKKLTRSQARALAKRRSLNPHVTGAFRYTTTPEDGVRLVIVGMPNVGKSSLLNGLRRVGTGKGKAASTAPQPGHTRKLTGTVRITPEKKKPIDLNEPLFQLDEARASQTPTDVPPAIYVYDTPGIMVPFLGRGDEGSEKAMKLMVTAGMKTMWFDKMALADYILFRMNKQWAWIWRVWDGQGRRSPMPRPAYIEHLPLSSSAKPTNDISALMEDLATRAPGTLAKGGVRNLDAAADFFLTQWREGKLGVSELDLECFEDPAPHDNAMRSGKHDNEHSHPLYTFVRDKFAKYLVSMKRAARSGVGTSSRPARGADRASRRFMEKQDHESLRQYKSDDEYRSVEEESLLSKNQARRREKAVSLAVRNSRLREKGVPVKKTFDREGPNTVARGPASFRKHVNKGRGSKMSSSRRKRQ